MDLFLAFAGGAGLPFPFRYLGKTSMGATSAGITSFFFWDFSLELGTSSSSSLKVKDCLVDSKFVRAHLFLFDP